MLSEDEKSFWDKEIKNSGCLELARLFYPKIGQPEKVKELAISIAENFLGHYGVLLQKMFEEGYFKPELSDQEIRAIAEASLREDIKKRVIRGIFEKLQYPLYNSVKINNHELESLVNLAVKKGAQGCMPAQHPLSILRSGLLAFPGSHETQEDVDFSFYVFEEERYHKYVQPQSARSIVTLKTFHNVLLGKFEEARKIREQYTQHYSRGLAKRFAGEWANSGFFVETDSEEERYPLEYIVAVFREGFRELFPKDLERKLVQESRKFDQYIDENKETLPKDADISAGKEAFLAPYKRLVLAEKIANTLDGSEVPTPEIEAIIASFHSEDTRVEYALRKGNLTHEQIQEMEAERLRRAFGDQGRGVLGWIWGFVKVSSLLKNQKFIQRLGEKDIAEILNEKIGDALNNGNANLVYALKFDPYEPVNLFGAKVDNSQLLEAMISLINIGPSDFLSEECNITNDHFFGTMINEAYQLYLSIREEGGALPSAEALKKLVFLKMASQATEHYKGKGMKEIIKVYEDPKNAPYIHDRQVQQLLTKTVTQYFEEVRANRFFGEAVPYFHALVNSRLGDLVRDDQRIAPYFKLKEFLQGE
ncbi:hypothetical protein HY501_02100 [Candidatus Woesearchaeota archaeon]|nr:hypothetical protein [Candidatus Woesearchaeota archaeon]